MTGPGEWDLIQEGGGTNGILFEIRVVHAGPHHVPTLPGSMDEPASSNVDPDVESVLSRFGDTKENQVAGEERAAGYLFTGSKLIPGSSRD